MAKGASGKGALVFAILAGLFALLTLVFGGMFLFSGKEESLRAMSEGRRVLIDAASGTVSGNPYNSAAAPSQPEEPAPVVSDTAAPSFDVGTPQEPQEPAPTDTATDTPVKDALVGSEEDELTSIRVEPPTAASLDPVDASLLEQSDAGALPRATVTDSPFSRYRRPYTVGKDTPKVALIITGIGNRKEVTEQALQLPVNTSFAFSPYAARLQSWMESARNTGHEAWLELPVQPEDFPASDPGPLAVLNKQTPEERLSHLHQAMASAAGYTGLLLPPDENFSDNAARLQWLVSQTEERGLGLLLAEAPENETARKALNGHRRGSVFLIADEDLTPNAIRARLDTLTAQATAQGCAIGLMRPWPLSLKMAQEWVDSLVRQKVAFVPVSACVDS